MQKCCAMGLSTNTSGDLHSEQCPRYSQSGIARANHPFRRFVELWSPHLEGALVVIGNAPTALFALLEMINAGIPKPAAIAAFPVGFVGAANQKMNS